MKITLKLEELAMLLLGLYAFSTMNFSWWWFFGLLLVPDIGAVGYLFGKKTGAISYNLFHHKGIAILLYLAGIYFSAEGLQLCGVILFFHAAMDRIFGYGLKYEHGFKYTHLGEIGRNTK